VNNFIGVYENALPPDVCDAYIQFFSDMETSGVVATRQQYDKARAIDKQDLSGFVSKNLALIKFGQVHAFYENFWPKVYVPYTDKYSVIHDYADQTIYDLKLQKTEIGEGYHVWHAENMERATNGRVLSFTAYLNDVDVGGETEFLYYPFRVPPKKGTICVFPTGFTHTHRGNPPISNTKYVITGWVEF
jgi:hypothetical protein